MDEFTDDVFNEWYDGNFSATNIPVGWQPPDILTFQTAIYRRYKHAPHLQLVDEALMAAMRFVESEGRDGHGFQIITMPPRHGKTLKISRLAPPYVLGCQPQWRVIMASYGADLAKKNSRAGRNIINSPVYQAMFPHVRLDKSSSAAEAWDLDGYEGGVDAVGVGGGVTGKGGHIIIVDDPIKSREEAESATMREKVWNWFTDDLYTRREPHAAVIIVHTRWHMDDLIGRLLKKEPDKWRILNLPAIAETERADYDWRQAGEALWPERFDIVALRDIEATMSAYSFAALYQQRPVPAEGGLFKRDWFLPLVNNVPEIVHAVRFWDLAMSEKTSADFTAGVKIGQAVDGHYYVLDVAHKRLDWSEVTEYMAGVMLADGAGVAQGIEEKGYMSRAVQELNADRRLHGYAIFGYPVDKDKLTRALPFAAKCGAGLVHVVNGHFAQVYVEELTSFPNGAHDDMVDASSGAWSMIGQDLAIDGVMHYAEEFRFSESQY